MQVHDGNYLHFIRRDPVQHCIGEPMQDQSPADPGLELREMIRRFGNRVDAFFQCRLETLSSVWVSCEVPEERGSSLSFCTLLDAELPASHGLFASENPLASFAPRYELRAAGVDVGKALLHFIMPSALNLGLGFANAVEELER
jgi:hypothetical protein